MDKKLIKIFREVFRVPEREFRDQLSPDTVREWDSLSHLILAESLEKEFKIKIRSDEIITLTSVKKIKELLKEKGIK